jgi:hypothetical protein
MHAMNSVGQLLMLAQMRGSCLDTLFIFLQLWVFVFCSTVLHGFAWHAFRSAVVLGGAEVPCQAVVLGIQEEGL